jgi:hypothetical protein
MAHAQKPDFVSRRNGRAHLNRRGRQFSRLLAAEVCGSAVVMLDTPCSEVVWRVPATHSIRQFALHFPSRASPCAVTFQLDYTHWTQCRFLTCMCPLTFSQLLKKQMAPRRARAAGGTGMSSGSEGSVIPSPSQIWSPWTTTQNKICSVYGCEDSYCAHPPTRFAPVKIVRADVSLWYRADGGSIFLDTFLVTTWLQDGAIFLLLGLRILIVQLTWLRFFRVIIQLPWLRFFRAFSSVVRQMPGYNSPRRGTARTDPIYFFVLFYVLFFWCCSMYCLLFFLSFCVLFV